MSWSGWRHRLKAGASSEKRGSGGAGGAGAGCRDTPIAEPQPKRRGLLSSPEPLLPSASDARERRSVSSASQITGGKSFCATYMSACCRSVAAVMCGSLYA